MSAEMNFIVSVIFCSFFSQISSSREMYIPFVPSEFSSYSANQTLAVDPMDRAANAALQIGEFLRNYTIKFSNDTDPIGLPSSASKKAVAAAPAIYLQEESDGTVGTEIRGLGDLLQTNLVPFIVDNVLNPLIKRVLQSGGSVYSYFRGGYETTVRPTPARRPSSGPPRRKARPTTPKATTVAAPAETEPTSTDKNDSNGRKDEVENGGNTTSTTAPGISKYRVRHRERSTTTTPSSRKQYIPDEDDEDESGFLNKIKHV